MEGLYNSMVRKGSRREAVGCYSRAGIEFARLALPTTMALYPVPLEWYEATQILYISATPAWLPEMDLYRTS